MEDIQVILLKERVKYLEEENSQLKERLGKYTKSSDSYKRYYEKNKENIQQKRKDKKKLNAVEIEN